MNATLGTVLFLLAQSTGELVELAKTDRPAFAARLADGARSDAAKARQIVTWLGENFEWKATDYVQRTAAEIIERRGGNCAELAVVATALFQDLGISPRRVREINFHVESPGRQQRAEAMVEDRGLSASVFGERHNDHVWLEVYDDETGTWVPSDPSLGIVGLEAWLHARAWFGDRATLDPTSDDMLFPMGIFVLDDERNLLQNRTRYYMVEALDDLYQGRLSRLEPWGEWTRALDRVAAICLEAFQGRTNLHDHADAITAAGRAYERLRAAYEASPAPGLRE